MATDGRWTFDDYPGLFYHRETNEQRQLMATVRSRYIELAMFLLETCPQNRSLSLAMTALEDGLMRSIQSIAVEGERQEIGT